MTDEWNAVSVTRNEDEERFEMDLGGELGVLTYSEDGKRLSLMHTEVPKEREGEGHGGRLVRAALDYARAEGLAVVPLCPFVKAYIKRHPEYEPLVSGG